MTGDAWRNLFENWPESIPRRGIVVTTFNDNITFVAFMISGGILLLDREKPDQLGARKVLISYEAISAVKITDPIELPRFQVMGFQPPF